MRSGLIAAMLVTVVLLIAAALIRVLAIPKFTFVPGPFQLFLEQMAAAAEHLGNTLGKAGRGIVRAVIALGRGLVSMVKGLASLPRKIAGIPLVLSIAVGPYGAHEDVKTAMRDAVLHDVNRVSLFGLKDVNPGLIAAMTVSGILLVFALIVRIFVIPRFRDVPGRFQMLLELAVNTLDGLAKVADPGRRTFVGAYVFAAGAYIFVGTLFELLGLQAVTTNGASVTLPAPLSDVNAAICMGCLSYLVIFAGGVARNGLRGAGATLKEFSLPISMSFRLFGALLSGLLVTFPVAVGVVFTLLHALVQTYVLCMLVGMYYEEVTEPPETAE